PVQVGETLHWDVLRLWHEIKIGIAKVPAGALSIGVDAPGVDTALLDKQGNLLANPVHYRDKRTDDMMEWVFDRVPRREIFDRTGIQFIQLNSIYQLASLVRSQSPLLDAAETLLTFPDLFHYWMTGSKTCEFTHVTTTQLYNPNLQNWDTDLIEKIGLPSRIFPEIVQPGTKIGEYEGISVILPPGHDTGSAVVGVPATGGNYAYLSSGTWSLLGLELDAPVINDAAYHANVTSEGGAYGTFRFLKNIMGLWLIQQCFEIWEAEGTTYSFTELAEMVQSAPDFRSFIDPDDSLFFSHGMPMPERVREFCKRTDQPAPENHAQIIATIYESLSLKYRYFLEKLKEVSGQPIDRLHIIGGGSQNTLLCQMTANAIGMDVYAGPVEATALGNGMVQMIGAGVIGSLAEARQILSQSVQPVHYIPQETDKWDAAYERFLKILTT
ncbi:MAG: rhamnulokinase, partial [Aggregatilineales bacterium]